MSSAREQILARARGAVASIAPLPDIPREYRPAGSDGGTVEEVEARFRQRVADYGATVRAGRREDVEELLAAAARAHGASRLAVPPGWSWTVPGVQLVPDEPALAPSVLDGLDGVITGCALAIAQTGTIVLDGGSLSGRRALTLIPDLHICLVESARIVPDVPDAIALLEDEGRQRSPLTFVSGPSATVDIGFERVEGVHGPRRLDVVVVAPPRTSRACASD